jgi:NADH dehydrogenase/NADH:ubiquinone oxidoreductase subunit G
MFISDLMKLKMGAPVCFEGDNGGASGGSTVMTGEHGGDAGTTGTGTDGDGGAGSNGDNGGGGSYGDWRDQLSDDLKGNDVFKGMEGKTLSDFANNFVELKGKADKFTPPAEDATDEQRTTWLKDTMKTAGYDVPEGIEGYEIVKPDFPDGMYYNEENVQAFLKKAHEIGIPKQMVQAIIKANNESAIAQHNQDIRDEAKAHTDKVNAMKAEYGEKYKSVVENSHRAAKAFGGDKFLALLEQKTFNGTRLGDLPEMVETFNNIAEAIGEDKAGVWLNNGGPGKAPTNVDKQGNTTLDFSKSMGKVSE